MTETLAVLEALHAPDLAPGVTPAAALHFGRTHDDQLSDAAHGRQAGAPVVDPCRPGKQLFLVGAAGFAAASAAGGASGSFAMLVTARAAQGAFAAVLAPAALSLLTTTFSHPDERGKAFGIYGGIATAGASVGLLLGGALTQYLNWRWTMFINVPIAGIVITGGVVFLSSHVAEAWQRVDRAGAALGGLGLFAVVYGFAHAATKPGSAGWADPRQSARSRPASCYWPPS
jgi:MFS family permease